MSKLNMPNFILAALTTILLTGCASSPDSRYYLLSAKNDGVQSSLSANPTIMIAPVNVPSYIRRNEIVFRTDSNTVTVNQHDRWAERLDKNIADVLSENLTQHLSSSTVFTEDSNFVTRPDIRIHIDINQFGLMASGHVTLNVSWEINDRKNDTTQLFSDLFTLRPKSNSVVDIVAAMSAVLAELSVSISQKLIEA